MSTLCDTSEVMQLSISEHMAAAVVESLMLAKGCTNMRLHAYASLLCAA